MTSGVEHLDHRLFDQLGHPFVELLGAVHILIVQIGKHFRLKGGDRRKTQGLAATDRIANRIDARIAQTDHIAGISLGHRLTLGSKEPMRAAHADHPP